MAASAVKIKVCTDGVAIITINNPPTNTLNNYVMEGLQLRFTEAHSRRDVKAIVLTGANENFSFGVDISLFQRIQNSGCDGNARFVPAVPFIKMIEDGPKPVVAAAQGFAIGAALEMALACHSRVAGSTARFSLPDFHNGIIPGLGGTQRLPRLVGLKKTLDILWMTRPLTAMEAMEAGLIDEVILTGDVIQKACSRALDIAEKRLPWKKSLERVDRLESLEEALQILRQARAKAKKDHPNLIHPLICIDIMEEGVLKGGLAGATMEEKFCHGLVTTPPAKALMHVFFARRSVTKVAGITDKALKPRKISRTAVLGCGLTGAAIATSLVLSKIPTLVKAVNEDDLQAGLKSIEENLKSLVARGTITQRQLKSMAALVSGSIDYEHFHDIDLVIEAVEENTPNKYKVFQDLADICNTSCILASSSSLVDLDTIAVNMKYQDRVLGMHFISPAYDTELVEISYCEKTSSQAVLDLLTLVKSIKKLPLVVKNSTGLIVDRLCFTYSIAALIMTDLGVDRDRIHVLLEDFGMSMVSFRFQECQRKLLAPEFQNYLEHSQKLPGFVTDRKVTSLADEDILDMLLFPVVNEAYQILNEGIAMRAEQVDIASILGMGFPNYRGGIVFWAHAVGTKFILSQLTKWSKLYGKFFKPCSWLVASINQCQVHDQIADQVTARL